MWLTSKQEEPSSVQQGNWATSWRNKKKKRRRKKWLFAAMAHVACRNFRERSLWVRPSNQAWFDMADTEFGMKIFELPERVFNSFWTARVSFDDFECSSDIWMDSSAHNSSNASVASSDQVIPRFFLGERERRVSSVAILWQPRMRMVKITTKRPGTAPESFYTKEFFWHGASLTRAETTSGTPKILGIGATLHLGAIRLHIENWECRALKLSARCQKFGVPCRFFSACKWG